MKFNRLTLWFAFLAIASSSRAQDEPLPSLADYVNPIFVPGEKVNSRPTISLDGEWKCPSNERHTACPTDVILEQKDGRLWISEHDPRGAHFGERMMSGRYQGENTVRMSYRPDLHLDEDVQLTILDPDRIDIGSLILERVSPPALKDVPCGKDNEFHVSAEGALARADVAADANQTRTALCWASIAGHLGNAKGEYAVGMALRGGIGTEKDPALAIKWLLLSAQQDFYEAQTALAEMYARAEGTPYDSRQSTYWSQRAARTYKAQRLNEAMGEILHGMSESLNNGFGTGSGSQTRPSDSSPRPGKDCVVGASPGPNPNRHIQTYCSSR